MTNSIRDLDRVEDRIRQHRQVVREPVLVVEGVDDILVLKSHVPENTLFAADGKRNVVRALRALLEWKEPAVVGIADADFDEPDDLVDLEAHIIHYENRDLEGMLIVLGVLATVVENQGSAKKLQDCGGATSLIERLVDEVKPITSLRAANARENWGLAFDQVVLAEKVERQSLEIKIDSYSMALVSLSDTSIGMAEVLSAMKIEVPDDRGPRGRDVVSMAGVALRHVAGTLQLAQTKEPILTGQLHSSAAFPLSRSTWLEELVSRIASLQSDPHLRRAGARTRTIPSDRIAAL